MEIVLSKCLLDTLMFMMSHEVLEAEKCKDRITALVSYCVSANTCFTYYLTEFFSNPYAQGVISMNFTGDSDRLAVGLDGSRMLQGISANK